MIEPILDNLLLEPITNKKPESGIYRPEGAKEKPEIGKILAIGPEVKSFTVIRSNGEIIEQVKVKNKDWKAVYKKWQATEVKVDGKTYILVAEKDVLGVIK